MVNARNCNNKKADGISACKDVATQHNQCINIALSSHQHFFIAPNLSCLCALDVASCGMQQCYNDTSVQPWTNYTLEMEHFCESFGPGFECMTGKKCISLVTRWGARCIFCDSLQHRASYMVCIITDFSPDQTLQRLLHPCNAGELPDASRHHQCITSSGSDTPLPLVWVEHNIYTCDAVSILQYAGLPSGALVPGISTASVHQQQCRGVHHQIMIRRLLLA